MKKRLLRLAVAEAVLLLLGVYFEPSHCVHGWLHGEAFFDGRPTSWWRGELERWDVFDFSIYVGLHDGKKRNQWLVYQRDARWIDRLRDWVFPKDGPIIVNIVGEDLHGPAILYGGADAEPVLRALQHDRSARVRRLARIGLNVE